MTMPNHIKSKIKILGSKEQVKEVLKRFSTHYKAELNKAHDGSIICNTADGKFGWLDLKTGVFTLPDRSKVNGLPEGYELSIKPAFDHFPDFNKVIPQPANIFNGNLGKEEKELCKREGRPTWYNWNIENWGTKWNSYSNEKLEENIFTFETAWSGVPNIIAAMSRMFPKVAFHYQYADEDTGQNTGIYELKNGIKSEYHPENGSTEAYELAFELWPGISNYYEFKDGEYHCKD